MEMTGLDFPNGTFNRSVKASGLQRYLKKEKKHIQNVLTPSLCEALHWQFGFPFLHAVI